ncbi:MAG TPA: hypothetical protein VM327_03195 [Candidatus Thermoplasmatota archaeon]|nr:hypothetical protein [Candidatus Thermoplasmatota archaeon]
MQLLGKTSRLHLRRAYADADVAGDVAKLGRALRRAFAYALPKVADAIHNYPALRVLPHFVVRAVNNPFLRSPHVCGVAATLVALYEEDEALTGQQLAQKAVARYLAWATVSAHTIRDTYRQVLDPPEGEGRQTYVQDKFQVLTEHIEDAIKSADSKELAGGIASVLEALLILREKREEETTLTVDIGMPLSCSWELAHDLASKGTASGLHGKAGQPQQALLRQLGNASIGRLIKELEKAGRWARRGVCQLYIRETEDAAAAGLFKITHIWQGHRGAPLSQLYGLDWGWPSAADKPDVRVILLDNGAISVQCQGDPLFEYLLGAWTLVDLKGKMHSLWQCLPEAVAEKEDVVRTLFRVARLSYQLGYHNHGANIALHLKGPADGPDKIAEFRKLWTPEVLVEDRIPIPPANMTGEGANLGRLVYSLTLQDGMSLWGMDPDGKNLWLHDFGKYADVVEEKDITPTWPTHRDEMGFDATDRIKGGRHRAAYVRSKWNADNEAIVFCVSQDGYIQVFVDGIMAPLR